MVDLNFLRALSYSGAVTLLLEEGYLEADCMEKELDASHRLFAYPFVLELQNEIIERIYYVEYCSLVIDDEYVDGRTTWEADKVDWLRLSEREGSLMETGKEMNTVALAAGVLSGANAPPSTGTLRDEKAAQKRGEEAERAFRASKGYPPVSIWKKLGKKLWGGGLD